MQINLGHVTASFTLDVYGHTENVLAVRGSDYRILFDGEGGGANHSFFAAEQRGLRNEAWSVSYTHLTLPTKLEV